MMFDKPLKIVNFRFFYDKKARKTLIKQKGFPYIIIFS